MVWKPICSFKNWNGFTSQNTIEFYKSFSVVFVCKKVKSDQENFIIIDKVCQRRLVLLLPSLSRHSFSRHKCKPLPITPVFHKHLYIPGLLFIDGVYVPFSQSQSLLRRIPLQVFLTTLPRSIFNFASRDIVRRRHSWYISTDGF